MGLNRFDFAIIAIYLIGITLFGLRFRKRQRTLRDYFLAGRDIPWWAISLSIVAAETSTLTIISIPGLAYDTNLTFLQVVLGYVAGRIIISFVLLPHYFRGDLYTAYELIERRFGSKLRSLTSGLFLLTRAAAEGVRVYAVSIVVAIALGTGEVASIAIITLLTLIYTLEGGLAAVICRRHFLDHRRPWNGATFRAAPAGSPQPAPIGYGTAFERGADLISVWIIPAAWGDALRVLHVALGAFRQTGPNLSHVHCHSNAAWNFGPVDCGDSSSGNVEPERGVEFAFIEHDSGFFRAPASANRRPQPDDAHATGDSWLGDCAVQPRRPVLAQGRTSGRSRTANRVHFLWRAARCLFARGAHPPRESAWRRDWDALRICDGSLLVEVHTSAVDVVGGDWDCRDIPRGIYGKHRDSWGELCRRDLDDGFRCPKAASARSIQRWERILTKSPSRRM